MSAVPVPAMNENVQAVMPKSMVPDLGWFDRDQTRFKDWQRGIQLYLKSNRVMETGDRITVILACLREDIAEIYA